MFALVFFLNLFITIRFTDVIDHNLDRIVQMELDHISNPQDLADPVFRGFNERVFIVYFDENQVVTDTMISFPDMITEADAITNATNALLSGNTLGWFNNYRYQIADTGSGQFVAFIDGDFFAYAITSFRNISLIALGVTSVLVVIFLYFASKQAIKPIVESHERQKQFMTDASHELKTPLTVISANTEIMKMNDPNNEWLESIDRQTKTLTHLIQQIIKMSKLDESQLELTKEDTNMTLLLENVIDDFNVIIDKKQLILNTQIEDDVHVNMHEPSMKEVLSILLDNAVKYCDEEGQITIELDTSKKTHLKISNSFSQIDEVDLASIFDRFYRGDLSRASDGSFGLGLSIASSVVKLHHGTIKAYKNDQNMMTMEIVLP